MANDDLLGQLDAAAEFVAMARARMFRHMVVNYGQRSGLISKTQSPLEAAFALWWMALDAGDGGMSDGFSILVPQKEVEIQGKKYRLDFSVEAVNQELVAHWPPIAVELDGHAYHERTPEQVRLRDSRDRALVGAGWRVLHFSYSEFMHDPLGCVLEVMKAGVDSHVKASVATGLV